MSILHRTIFNFTLLRCLLILLSFTILYSEEGCMDGGATDYTTGFGDGADGITACNYNSEATIDDESCTYINTTTRCCPNGVGLAGEIMDCHGDCLSNPAYFDDCGICSEGFTQHPPNADMDCHGNCSNCGDLDGSPGSEICVGTGYLGACNNNAIPNTCGIDECGVCDGSGKNVICWDASNACENNDCPFNEDDCPVLYPGTVGMENYLTYEDICVPDDFSTTVGTMNPAFYYFTSVTINGTSVDENDWVGAFKGDICVGSRKWDISVCGDDICDVSVHGETQGYMLSGEIPTFRIFDASDIIYYEAEASGMVEVSGTPCGEEAPGCMGWDNNRYIVIPSLIATEIVLDLPNSKSKPLLPEKYNISNVYPNPFNPIISITYTIPINSYVSIAIYDMLGNQITFLINNFQTSGYHTINWNASSYPSGVYFIRMESGEFSQTQKVLLVK